MAAKLEGASAAIDIATKIIVTLAIPVATFFITHAINEQKAAFEQSAKLRDMNLDLTEKFYQILGSPQFKCFDESKTPLLQPILDHYKAHIPDARRHIDADVIRVLYQQTLQNEECRASKEARHLVRDLGGLPRATPAEKTVETGQVTDAPRRNGPSGERLAEKSAASEERRVQLADATADVASTASVGVATEPASVPAHPAGWVAVGRFNGILNQFANFSVFAEHRTSGELAGTIRPETLLRTRWPAFLRIDASDAFEAPNPVLRVLPEGTCVKVLSSTDLGGQTWAAITLEPRCRPGQYE